jgi:DNA-binding IclR family transcriptional regulator
MSKQRQQRAASAPSHTSTARPPSAAAGARQLGTPRKIKTVRAIERAIDILECLAEARREMSIPEIERATRLHRPTLYRMLYTLSQKGLIRAVGDPLRYQLDYGVARFADTWYSSLDIQETATPLLTRLWQELDETVALFLLYANRKRCSIEMVSPQVISFSRGTGYTEDLPIGASGQSILAFLPEERIRDVLEAAQINTPEFRARLAAVRERGYAITQNEVILGAVAVAAPFYTATSQIGGSVAVFGPEVRFKPALVTRCADEVKRTARELSALLGYRGTPNGAAAQSL